MVGKEPFNPDQYVAQFGIQFLDDLQWATDLLCMPLEVTAPRMRTHEVEATASKITALIVAGTVFGPLLVQSCDMARVSENIAEVRAWLTNTAPAT